MIERALKGLVEHPHGLLIVITLSFVVGLVLVLPLVDEYSALRDESDNLVQELEEAKADKLNLPFFEKRIARQQEELGALESQAISDEEASEFRHHIVALVRDAGCQIRRVSLGEPRQRDWFENDNPIQSSQQGGKKQKPTGFELKSRVFSLSVSGSADNVRTLLAAISAENSMAHTKSLSLRPADADRKEVVLDLELWLFELAKKKPVSA